ncbi:MAG: hypothetical protein AABX93_00340 [Nanoarchaeota archaeon]
MSNFLISMVSSESEKNKAKEFVQKFSHLEFIIGESRDPTEEEIKTINEKIIF